MLILSQRWTSITQKRHSRANNAAQHHPPCALESLDQRVCLYIDVCHFVTRRHSGVDVLLKNTLLTSSYISLLTSRLPFFFLYKLGINYDYRY